jgi:hypothetical protein
MRSDEQRYKTIGLMIFTVIIIFSVVGIVIIGFKMVKKNEEAKLVAAADTEYMKKQKQDVESQKGSQEEKSTEESLNIEEFLILPLTRIRIRMWLQMQIQILIQKSVRQMQGYILFRGMRRVQTATRRQIIYPIQR